MAKTGDRIQGQGVLLGMVKNAITEDGILNTFDPIIIGTEEFAGREDLETVCLSEKIEEVGPRAFYASSVRKLHLANNTRSLNRSACEDCVNLEIIDLGGVEKIGDKCFKNCISLKKIRLPLTLKNIGNNVFDGCSYLTYISCGEDVADKVVNQFSKRGGHSCLTIDSWNKEGQAAGRYWVGTTRAFKAEVVEKGEDISLNIKQKDLNATEWTDISEGTKVPVGLSDGMIKTR